MQISRLMTSSSQLCFDQIWWTKVSQPILIRYVWFFAVRSYLRCSNMNLTFLLPWQHIWFQTSTTFKASLAIFCVLFFIFANGASSAWSSNHVNSWPCSVFLSRKPLKYWDQVRGHWKNDGIRARSGLPRGHDFFI